MEKVEILNSASSKETYYKCHDGFERNYKIYESKDCSYFIHKPECSYRYDEERDIDKNKVMKINEDWEELKDESEKNVLSEKGIKNRQIPSIQTGGHLGDIKRNDGLKKFNHRSLEKNYKEMMFNIIGRNLNRYHRFKKSILKRI